MTATRVLIACVAVLFAAGTALAAGLLADDGLPPRNRLPHMGTTFVLTLSAEAIVLGIAGFSVE
ncbi:hypothetical protein [Streptomyces boncukensis]|uniref:Uncharacterized protein n=1 Tax=Streptomyces boncukensis TaxID=2711219 RepID=A0A6G4X0I8_9ACTN|nr:hypothetical protein [Streptomyces boncukensis]NGO70181.1 hypothetical protein [Streptomyces boncukensis]